jgi:hypothetical protein
MFNFSFRDTSVSVSESNPKLQYYTYEGKSAIFYIFTGVQCQSTLFFLSHNFNILDMNGTFWKKEYILASHLVDIHTDPDPEH